MSLMRFAPRPARARLGSHRPVARLNAMGKTWLLDTETKGTGAHVVPLEQALERGASEERDLAVVALERPRRASKPIETPAPLTFKVVDVMSARVLAEGITARMTVDLLAELRSVLDVRIYVWMQRAERWRLLSLQEQKALWGFRQGAAVGAAR
jgi:hypothetical protein